MKYYTLIDKVYRIENLKKAYGAVKANNGAPGVDGQAVRAFGENLDDEIAKLHLELKTFSQSLTQTFTHQAMEEMVRRLNPILRGWINYFRIANCKGVLRELMGWIRRRLRMKKMREWKAWKALHKALRRRGYKGEFEKISMRRWRNSASPLISMALPNTWFDEIGLINLERYEVGILHRYYES